VKTTMKIMKPTQKTMSTNEKDIEKTMKIITNIEIHMKNNGKTMKDFDKPIKHYGSNGKTH